MPHPPQSRPSGFSLVELLTVLAVLAVLAGILIPVLSGMRDKARATQSISNLRQIGLALQLYVQDNGGRYPYWKVGDGTPSWYSSISEDGRYGLRDPSSGGYSEVLYSPVSGKDGSGGWPDHNPDYGINTEVINKTDGDGNTRGRQIADITNPSVLALVVSSGSSGNAFSGDFRFQPNRFSQVSQGFRSSAGDYGGYGWMAFRYPPPTQADGDMSSSSAAVLFVDGHAELIPYDDERLQTREGRERLLLP